MQSLWNDADAQAFAGDPIKLRVYTSRLLGRAPSLVLHGGGNTSAKTEVPNLFGEREEVLFIKGSGWDLATIEAEGFAPVKLSLLRRMAELERLTDTDMVQAQRAAMTNPSAPTPSVEAILHAIIPFPVVDHTHADAVVAISNTPDGEKRIREVYGNRVLVVPYVMPGFVLARKVFEMTRGLDWATLDGMILLNHGVFTWGADARSSYEQMIRLVTQAEDYLQAQKAPSAVRRATSNRAQDLELNLARFRRAASLVRGGPMIACLDDGAEAAGFSAIDGVASLVTRGPLTPDHVIRTKPHGAVLTADAVSAVDQFADSYRAYYKRHAAPGLAALDAAPRWAVWPGVGTVSLGPSARDADVAGDIVRHTVRAIQLAEALGQWQALPERDLFEVEYWELEQAKLRAGGKQPPFQGKIALVTGAASGIGRACAEQLHALGAAVVALDIDSDVVKRFSKAGQLGLMCDVTNANALHSAVAAAVRRFGGLDIVVSNAGVFSPTERLDEVTDAHWQQSLALNLTSHRLLLQYAAPFLRLGFEPTVIINASKNVPAPGPGAGAYSVAKAGLTQLARVAALELAKDGIRVNVIHPHAVFDTAAWTDEVLDARAKQYGITVDQYKRNNLLGVEVTSADVAALVCAMAGAPFAKTTGAQVPIDGGSDRVI